MCRWPASESVHKLEVICRGERAGAMVERASTWMSLGPIYSFAGMWVVPFSTVLKSIRENAPEGERYFEHGAVDEYPPTIDDDFAQK